MPHRYAGSANKRLLTNIEHGAFDDITAERIRTVEYDDRDARFCTGFQAMGNGPNECVDSCSNILEIDYEAVDILEHF
jgi:hypothetical protein